MPKPLRWGILGASRINRRFMPGLHGAGHTVSIIGSRDPERGKAAAAEYQAARSGTYEDVLSATDVDAVYIPLPNSLHVPWTIRAAEAGKHILCEKPLAPTVDECEQMVAACEQHGVHLVEAFMYRYHPVWSTIWDVVNSGKIGEIRRLHAAFSFMMGSGPNIRLDPTLGGGSIQDVGCYCINVARWFLGEPSRVRGITRDNRGVGVDTHAVAALEFPSGALATLTCAFDTAGAQTLDIFGTKGRITVEPCFQVSEATKVHIVDADGERVESAPAVDSYAMEVIAMAALIQEGKPSLTPGSDAAATQKIVATWQAND